MNEPIRVLHLSDLHCSGGNARGPRPAVNEPIRVLHLSDLHFAGDTPTMARLQWLLNDLQDTLQVGKRGLHHLVVSGDFTDRGSADGFVRASIFISELVKEFGLTSDRCILVPGNHDVTDLHSSYDWQETADQVAEQERVPKGDIFLVRNLEHYPLRIESFSNQVYSKIVGSPYPLVPSKQGIVTSCLATGLQFLAFNSAWQIDQFARKRSGLHTDAVANAVRDAKAHETEERKTGSPSPASPLLRLAVWHHAVTGAERMQDTGFLEHLMRCGVKIVLHGDVHAAQQDLYRHWHMNRLHIIGAGSFGASKEDRPDATPRLYNLLEISPDRQSVRVHTRSQPNLDGVWQGWNQWARPDGGDGGLPYYDISLSLVEASRSGPGPR